MFLWSNNWKIIQVKPSYLFLILLALPIALFAQTDNVGAYLIKNDSCIGINENQCFPMHSVMKFPQALFVANYLEKNGLSLDSEVLVRREDLVSETWSPMLKMVDDETMFSFGELLSLSLQQSDNNACDILFEKCGSPMDVENYIKSIGFHDIKIRMTERQMHDNSTVAVENSCTPKAMADLLKWFYLHHSDTRSFRYVWDCMAACHTGEGRIPAAVPAGAIVVHKTGTGFLSPDGTSDMNDVGMVFLPDGQCFVVAVFVRNSNSETQVAEFVRQLLVTFPAPSDSK